MVSASHALFGVVNSSGFQVMGGQSVGFYHRGDPPPALATESGAWRLQIRSLVPGTYSFSVGVNADPPNPAALQIVSPPTVMRFAPVTRSSEEGPHAVIALIDTGANP